MRPEQQLLHGPALPAVLKILERGACSTYQVVSRLRVACPEATVLGDASIVALLQHLAAQRLVASTSQPTQCGQRSLFSLTRHGQERLTEEMRRWQSLTALLASPEGGVKATAPTSEAPE